MLAALASATLIVAGSLAVGQALLLVCGRREPTWLAGPVGLALLLAVAATVAHAGGHGIAIAITLGCLTVASAVGLGWSGFRHGLSAPALIAAGLAALFAALPFIAAGNVGVLGVGLVNDDMASHLLIADWIDERFRPEPVFIDQGYPLGPHALVTGLGTLLGASSIDVFAGLILALPALTALVAFGALSGLSPVPRTLGAIVVALPYMVAAYLAQEAFKEPILAVFLLAFALLLPTVKRPLDALPLGLLAAGAVYAYSFPGLAWLAGTAIAWLGIEWLRTRRLALSPWAVAAGLAVLVVALAPELPRLLDFVDFRALDPDRANEGGLGNLGDQLEPLTAFGIWPTSEFRLDAGAGSLPAAGFYLGAAIAALALVVALPRWIRRHGAAIPAALLTAAALYLFARAWGTVYTSAKALAIIAPLITLIVIGGLLARPRPWLAALAAVVAVGTAFSSFLILRQAPVGPEEHMVELAEIRSHLDGEKVLFLGRDNFILYELRGARPFVATRNYYVPDSLYVKPNTELDNVFEKFDFDTVTASTLAEFPYVLTTRAEYASAGPPAYEVAATTDSYSLWRKTGAVGERRPAETDAEPGRVDGCPRARPATVSWFGATPVRAEWDPSTIDDGDEATATLTLPGGTWDLSLRYDSTRPVTLAGPGYEVTLPGNLDYRGPAPFWAAGTVDVERKSEVQITARVEAPPFAGRMLGASSVAHLGEVAATTRDASGSGPRGCEGYVDWYVPRRQG
jgi:hypothetical protein